MRTLSLIGGAVLLGTTALGFGVAGSTTKTIEFANYTSVAQNITLQITMGNITQLSPIVFSGSNYGPNYLSGVYTQGNVYSVKSGKILPGQQMNKSILLKGRVSGKGDVPAILGLDYSTARGLSGNAFSATGAAGSYEGGAAWSGPCIAPYSIYTGIYVQIASYKGSPAFMHTTVAGDQIGNGFFPQ